MHPLTQLKRGVGRADNTASVHGVVAASVALILVLLPLSVRATVTGSPKPAPPKLIGVAPRIVADRKKTIAARRPHARLVAYLNCGGQLKSTGTPTVEIAQQNGSAYQFPVADDHVPLTQATVVFDGERIVFRVTGLTATKHYTIGLTWWDFDDGGRTEMVVARSLDGKRVQLIVPAIRLPDYETDRQGPAEKVFTVPAHFAAKGGLEILVDKVTGVNAVVSEVWVWQTD